MPVKIPDDQSQFILSGLSGYSSIEKHLLFHVKYGLVEKVIALCNNKLTDPAEQSLKKLRANPGQVHAKTNV